MTTLRTIGRAVVAVGLLLVAQFAVAALPAQAAAPVLLNRAGPFILRNAMSNDCLDQDHSNGIEYPRVLAYVCTFGDNQLWYIDYYSNGYVKVVNYKSRKCLDQDYSNGREHENIVAWVCNENDNQFWGKYGDLKFRFNNLRSGKYLDQAHPNGQKSETVLAFEFKEVTNQFWKYVNVE